MTQRTTFKLLCGLSLLWLIALVSLASGAISATYDPASKLWLYQYESFPKVKGHDISHVTIDLSCIDAVESHSSSYDYNLDFGKKGFKWDDLRESKNHEGNPTFEITSYHPPRDGVFTVKAGREVVSWTVPVPSCIPEPRTYALAIVAGLILILRRKRTS